MPRQKNRHGVPDRWLDYQNVGRRIPGTRFISFKVPLKQALSHSLTEAEVFGPWELMEALEEQEEELGLIIDLTYTTRYYTVEDVPDGLQYLKIFTVGHEVPSDPTILNFKQAVTRFLLDNQNNEKLIGVHCTHGLNRTGYLVCRYLIDVDGMEPVKAIELFNAARGHRVERDNYLQDLKAGPQRSNAGMMKCELEVRKGRATRRPPAAAPPAPHRVQRPPEGDARSSYGRPPQRGRSQGSPGWTPQRPKNPHPRPGASYQTPRPPRARWGPPHPEAQAQCRQASHVEQSDRTRPPQPEPAWAPPPHHAPPRRGRDPRDHQDQRHQRHQPDPRDNRDPRLHGDQRHQWDHGDQRHQWDHGHQWDYGTPDRNAGQAFWSFQSDWTQPDPGGFYHEGGATRGADRGLQAGLQMTDHRRSDVPETFPRRSR